MREHFKGYLLVNGGIILGSFLVFGLLFYFLSTALASQVTKISSSRSAILQRSTELESLSRLKTDSAAAAELQKSLDALLPSQDGLIGFPQFVNSLGRTHSLSLTFSFEGAPVQGVAPDPGHVDFSADVEGDQANIRSFVEDLEGKTTKFLVNLTKIVLTPRSGSVYHADIRGQVFFQENKSAPQ